MDIRLYKEGDEIGIMKLFHEVFGREMTLEEWRWKYTGRRNEKVYSAVAVHERDGIVAHYGGMPHRMIYQGREVYGLAIGDVMVHARHRGFKLFKDVASLVPDEAVRDGIILGYGFPNERALRLPEKLGLYEKIEDVCESNKGTRFWNNASRYVYKLSPLNYDDRRIDDLWEEVKSSKVLSVVRDADYLRWRYQRHPLFSYELWGLRKRWSSRLRGLAVLRREHEKERVLIVDFVSPATEMAALFQKIENVVYTAGGKRLTLWHPEYLKGKMIRMGFSVGSAGTSIPRTTHEQTLRKNEIAGRFFYTMGDTDFL
jgi:hypothetical protein